jgi:diamine N-acetyltransferase
MTANASHRIVLREITAASLAEILALEVAPDQHHFVASNSKSIAQAHFEPAAWFRGIYAGDTPVGFAMLYDPTRTEHPDDAHVCWIWRLMIAAPHQRKGFGKEAIRLLTRHARSLRGVTLLRVSFVPGPGDAGAFYRGLGFHDTGEVDHGEIVLERRLDAHP